MRKLFCRFFPAIFLLLLLSACSGGESNPIRIDLTGGIASLDPQFTESSVSRMVLYNVMEGLTVELPDGSVQPGLAESWQFSADGLRCTFHLREGLTWEDGTPLTASDFVFAFRRMFNRDVTSPYAESYLYLENAREILGGTAGIEQLGVRAVSDTELVFELADSCPDLLRRLSDPSALPCNQAFFESTRARYGLSNSYFLSNGPFSLSSWDNSKSIVLKKNQNYHDADSVLCPEVYLYIGREDPASFFKRGRSDLYPLSASLLSEYGGYELHTMQNTVECLTFNRNSPFLCSTEVRRALLGTVDRDEAFARLEGKNIADSFVAPNAAIDGKSYSESAARPVFEHLTSEQAADLLTQGIKTLGVSDISNLSILLPESAQAASLGGYLQRVWQDSLGLYVNLEILPDSDFNARLNAGKFDITLLPVVSNQAGPYGSLSFFASNSPRNPAGTGNPELDAMLDALLTSDNPIRDAAAIEQYLADCAIAMPLYTEADYYAIGKGVSGIGISFDGRYYFKYAFRS